MIHPAHPDLVPRDPLAWREEVEERAAIYEFDAGLPRLEAELRAQRDCQHLLMPRPGRR